jgi:hypothetical protein
MHINGWMIAVLVVFFVFSAVAIYRCLLSVCRKLCAYWQDHEQATSPEGRS